jgi:hypothetical protein
MALKLASKTAAAILGLASVLAASSASAQTNAAETSRTQLPVNLSRIRDGLKRPEGKFFQPQRQPDFRVDIAEEQRFRDLIDLLDFSGGPSLPAVWFGGPRTQPLFNVNLNGVGHAVVSGIAKARRERAERIAQEEVQRALNQFCATHECAAR